MNKPSCSGAQYLVARATSQYLPRPAVIAYGLHKHMSHDITHKIFSQPAPSMVQVNFAKQDPQNESRFEIHKYYFYYSHELSENCVPRSRIFAGAYLSALEICLFRVKRLQCVGIMR